MVIIIKITCIDEDGYKIMQQNELRVSDYAYKRNPDQEAAKIAYEGWRKIRRDMSYLVTLDTVIYEETHDITQLVKEMENAPLLDLDLPF